MYGMKRTTVYLPKQLKQDLKNVSEECGRSEAELIREGVKRVVAEHRPQKPRFPLFASGDPTLAERADELLEEGFGEDS